MFQAKEKFLDRIEQSFFVFKDKFVSLILPLLIFNIFLIVLLPYIFGLLILGSIPLESIFSGESMSFLENISLWITFLFAGMIFIMLIYIICIIPIQIGIFKTIQQSLLGEDSNILENLKYGVSRIGPVFRTYWYIFAYTLLIPALIFIVGGISLNIGLYNNTSSTEIFTIIGGSLMGISIFTLLFFMIYRGTKATFALLSAFDADDFSKKNFSKAIKLTEKKWWRVFGNVFGVAVLGSLVIGLLSGIGESIAFFGNDWSAISDIETDSDELQYMLGSFTDFNIFFFVNSLIQTTLDTFLGIFITIFTYIMFKRLEFESFGTQSEEPKHEENNQSLETQEL